MRIAATILALLVSASIIGIGADLSTKDGTVYKNARLVKVEKKNSPKSYFKIIHEGGSKLINPVDLKPFDIKLTNGKVIKNIKIMDVTKEGISIYDSTSITMIKYEEMVPECRDLFEYNTGKAEPKSKGSEENPEQNAPAEPAAEPAPQPPPAEKAPAPPAEPAPQKKAPANSKEAAK